MCVQACNIQTRVARLNVARLNAHEDQTPFSTKITQ
jgi:hypothetical protein